MLLVVDAHCHAAPNWFEPVESLLFQMDANGVGAAVLVQDAAETSNDYLLECSRRFPGRFAPVVRVEVDCPDAAQVLAGLAEAGASGVRIRAPWRSPGDDPLLLWRTASRLGLPVSCPGRVDQFLSPEFEQLVRSLPGLPIVIEHLGSGNAPDVEDVPLERRRQVFELARFPNVYLKFHGLGEFCRRALPPTAPLPFEQPIPPLLDLAYQAFGSARMMWGSDFPPVSAREGYRNALRLPLAAFAGLSQADRAQLFGEVAGRVFRVRR